MIGRVTLKLSFDATFRAQVSVRRVRLPQHDQWDQGIHACEAIINRLSNKRSVKNRAASEPHPKILKKNATDLLFARDALQLNVVHGEVGVEDDALVLLPGAAVAERRRRRRRSAPVQRPWVRLRVVAAARRKLRPCVRTNWPPN